MRFLWYPVQNQNSKNKAFFIRPTIIALVFLLLFAPVSIVFAQEAVEAAPASASDSTTVTPVTEETPANIPNGNGKENNDHGQGQASESDQTTITPDQTEDPEAGLEEPKEKKPKKGEESTPESAALLGSSPQTGAGLQFNINPQVQTTVDQSTGALIYEYPIALPPGRGDMTPALSLKYDSRNMSKMDSIAGLGWDISIPFIQREPIMGTNHLYDKTYFSSSFSGNLIPSTDTSSSQFTDYYAENDNGDFLKYTYNSDNTWTMKAKDGKTYTFGGTSASRQDNPSDSSKVFKWMISKIADVNGNEIQYSYTKDNAQIYPSQIVYTYHASTAATHQVNFTYTTPSSYGTTVYNPAFAVITYKLLNTIAVTTTDGSNTYSDTYTLYHNNAAFIKQKLLSQVTRSFTSPVSPSSSNSVLFSYSSKTAGFENGAYSLENQLPQTEGPIHRDVRFADFDQNGYPDVLITVNDNAQRHNNLMMNNGSSFVNSDTAWGLPQSDELAGHFLIVDLNGDRYPDLHPVGYGTSETHHLYLNTGTSFSVDDSGTWEIGNYVTEAKSCGPNLGETFDMNAFFHDINNDGKNDILYFGGTSDFRVLLNTGSGWSSSSSYTFTPESGTSYTISPSCSGDPNQNNYKSLVDVNGDGLPDYVDQQKGTFLNTGSGFAYSAAYRMDIDKMNRSGFADINGDGLLDYIGYKLTNNCPRVWLNNGAGFTAINPTSYPPCTSSGVWSPGSLQFAQSNPSEWGALMDVTTDGLPDIVIQNSTNSTKAKVASISDGLSSWVNNATSWSPLIIPAKGVFGDINVDGILDFVTDETTWDGQTQSATQVFTGKASIPNRLTQITNRFGAQTVVTYGTAATDYSDTTTTPMPVVKKIVTQNIGYSQPDMVTQYAYTGGHYAIHDITKQKRFTGFQKVVVTESGSDLTPLRITDTYFHQGNATDSSNGEYSDHISKAGKIYRAEVKDGSGNVYVKTFNKWDKYEVYTGRNLLKLARTLEMSYDGDSDHKDKAVEYTYSNSSGNVTQQVEWGEVSGSTDGSFSDTGSDKFTTDVTYATGGSYNVTGAPATETAVDQSSNKVRETRHYYDSLSLNSVDKGNETKTEQWKDSTNYINTQRTFNTYGLVSQETDPRGKTITYSYDGYNLFPATVTNHLNQNIQYGYDYHNGKVRSTLDANNRTTTTNYDIFGRVLDSWAPDQSSGSYNVVVGDISYNYDANGGDYTYTQAHVSDTTHVYGHTYTDRLGRVVQHRQEAETANNFSVVDKAYNALGQLQKESLSYNSTDTSKTTATTTTALYVNYTYDPLDRVTSVVNAIGTTSTAYDDWKTSITDPRGKLKHLYNDAYGNLIRVDETNSGNTYTTTYEYNGNKNLTKITDALSNVRNFTYDGLGRRLTAQDLHASADATFGTWTYTYDNAGNVTSVVDPKSQTVNYTYDDLNRVATEDYTGQGGTEVTYTYDSGTDGKGRLTSVAAGGANTSYVYNTWGLVKTETKTINSTNYATSYVYSLQKDLLEITNPDSSKVAYSINTAGQLETVQRKESTDGSFINVVSNFNYGPHGKVTTTSFQNGVTTTNTYDAAKMYRLSTKVTSKSGTKFQDLTYTYDANSNVTQIVDASNTNSSKTVAYTYDDLNRLLSATATGVASGQSTYTHTYTYDAIGNILTRTDAAGTYSYAGNTGSRMENPHAVTSVGSINYTYDNNGNMLTETSGLSNTWDYNNRLTQAVKGGVTSTYTYDHSGQRVKLANGTTTNYYPSKFYNTDGTTPMKHIYAGDILVATVKGTGASAAVFTDHTDHLTGSNVVTNSSGIQEELMDYFPYGNIRIDAKAGSFSEQRKYAGHEYDADTGLSFMEARYYLSGIGRFMSLDQLYLDLGNKAAIQPDRLFLLLTDPQQLNSYAYVANNPLKYTDPNGQGLYEDAKKRTMDAGMAIVDATKRVINNLSEGTKQAWQNFENNPTAQVLVIIYFGTRGIDIPDEELAVEQKLITGPSAPKGLNVPKTYTRYVNGRIDMGQGRVYNGTVDLKPTIDRIQAGGTYPHPRDGSIFRNSPIRDGSRVVPNSTDPNYYREYVIPTPGINHAGPQRLIVGNNGEMYYSPDHYSSKAIKITP